ncbi:CsbD family protein [Spiractinospora alimapuensis]|uniref:CsbD family protein n=1 Tax=Spiractinospora alimapuensis TaxID=2820884 RepID=UPI002ED6F720
MSEEKNQSKVEQVKGKLKEAAGNVTGDERLRNEGRTEQAKGQLRETKEDVKDSVKGAVDGLRGRSAPEEGTDEDRTS